MMMHRPANVKFHFRVYQRRIGMGKASTESTDQEHQGIQSVSLRASQLWKHIEIYTEDIHNVLNCQNVAKHTEFYLG
jgi:hypothetical protein